MCDAEWLDFSSISLGARWIHQQINTNIPRKNNKRKNRRIRAQKVKSE